MGTEPIFRTAFWVLFGGMMVMQVYFASRVRQSGERVKADREAIEREGWWYAVVRAIGSLVLIGFLTSIILGVAWLVITVKAGLAVSNSRVYRYPFSIRFPLTSPTVFC